MKKKSAPPPLPIISHPSQTAFLLGHEEAETTFLSSWQNKRCHHAWLIQGPRGIGKATLAYHMARFLFSNADSMLPSRLAMPSSSLLFQRIAGGNWSDLLVIEKGEEKEITVETIREVNHFLHLTPAESSYRIVIIDSADDMNINAANALLKLLEEPPLGAFLFLSSHKPGSLLPTIRSRCRSLKLFPPQADIASQLFLQLVTDIKQPQADKLLQLAHYSPGLAFALHQHEVIPLYEAFLAALEHFPLLNLPALHTLGDMLALKEKAQAWEYFCYLIQRFLWLGIKESLQIVTPKTPEETTALQRLNPQISLQKWMEISESIPIVLAQTAKANLDKKQALLVITSMI